MTNCRSLITVAIDAALKKQKKKKSAPLQVFAIVASFKILKYSIDLVIQPLFRPENTNWMKNV